MNHPNLDVVEDLHPTPEQVRVIPLFTDLDERDLLQISKGLIRKRIPRHANLFRQGTAADSAFFVQCGVLDVVSALPGGGEVHLASLGPGSMLGESSLVAAGVRTATVRAETDVIGFSMERWFFQAAIAQASPAAVRILRQLIQIASERLQSQYLQLVAVEPGDSTLVSCRQLSGFGANIRTTAKTRSFPYRAYLPRLEFFSRFQPDEIGLFESQTQYFELPRGAMLFETGAYPMACFFVIRGALELFITHENTHVPLAILGPGAFLGTTEIISGGARAACSRVREDAAVLEISAGRLRGLLSGQSWFALKFQLAFCESLIVDLGKINKRVARKTSQISISMDSLCRVR